ncbi:MAG: ABC transporter ATP-binding protein [Candidatus Symbiothrix sp.]|jgi:ABC-2 type transport system ATP-binding protein|nr:ABC transporter ATP-binding protein [Candidatus Symbiothrix sp.]
MEIIQKIIQLNEVNFSYQKKRPLLSDLSLQLDPGHIYGLLGRNGEGKSTLLKLVAGLVFPQKGSIDVLGFESRKRKLQMLQDVYFFPEELPVFNLSIRELEKIYSPFYPQFSIEQFNHYLKEFDIPDKNWNLSKLSFGQKKKVMIAFGLATNTKIMLMDEPTNGLDIPSKGQFRRIIASTLEADRCLIISTHQVRDLDSLIDSIIIMDEHEIVFNESIDVITDKLSFKVYDTNEKDDSVIYFEDNLRGYYQVRENLNHEDSKLDIELLFNSILANKKRIKNIFKNK